MYNAHVVLCVSHFHQVASAQSVSCGESPELSVVIHMLMCYVTCTFILLMPSMPNQKKGNLKITLGTPSMVNSLLIQIAR